MCMGDAFSVPFILSWYRLFHGKCARTIFIHELRSIKKTNEWAQRTSDFFLCKATSEYKSFKHSPWCNVFMSYILRLFRQISKIRSHLSARAIIINTAKSATWRDIQSLLITVYFLFCYLIHTNFRWSDFTFRRETKIINMASRICRCVELWSMKRKWEKWDNLGFKNAKFSI